MTQQDPTSSISKDEVVGIVDGATKRMDFLITGVMIVLGLGFATLLIATLSPIIDAWRFRASSYEELKKEVQEQNIKMDLLIEELRLQNKVNSLTGR